MRREVAIALADTAGHIAAAVHRVAAIADSVSAVFADNDVRPRHESCDALRTLGTDLIARSHTCATEPDDRHPAFARIVAELVPDEARVVRFLAVAGPQPAIDVRTKTLFGVGSQQLARGISMVAAMAGCAWPDRDQHYFANLFRLGLLRFSDDPVDDFRRYALLEVQPAALTAADRAAKTVTIHRSVELTEFGRQFCETCFDTTDYTAGGWDTDERGDRILGAGPPARTPQRH